MTTAMPVLETQRLLVRPLRLDDLADVHQLLDVDLAEADLGAQGAQVLAEREARLRWTVLNYAELAKLYQPPYGERGISLRATGQLVGLVGFVPCLGPWEQLPGLAHGEPKPNQRLSPAFGMYWAVAPAFQQQGFATEAARAMLDYAFDHLNLARVVATTSHDNAASQAVMRRLGMRVESNAFSDPPWFQVAGVREYEPPLAATA